MPQLSVSPEAPELPAGIASLVERFAPHNHPVVITGPIGVGKTHLARVIHDRSGRAGEFVPVPLTSLQPGFENVTIAGHDKGAYTGSHRQRNGLLAQANRGTLFLDEIGDGSIDIQRVLLELLTDNGLRRLGEERQVRFDLRFILATHVDLDQAVREGRFREDLLSRLGHCWIHLPPLRERPAEIPALVDHYLATLAQERRLSRPVLSASLANALKAAPWLYNIRSLVNECRSLLTVWTGSGELGIGDLSGRFWNEVRRFLPSLPDDGSRVNYTLALTGENRGLASGLMGVSPRTFFRRASEGAPPRIRGRPLRAREVGEETK